jgi:hypothetical protein
MKGFCSLCNGKLVYYHPDFRRSSEVVEEILGKNFPGVVMCDFYGAYNIIENTQRRLVHLLRDISKEREMLADSKLLEAFDREVRDFISRKASLFRQCPPANQRTKPWKFSAKSSIALGACRPQKAGGRPW